MPDRVTVGDLTFDLRTSGPDDGEPVILLHGFPQTSREWLAQLDALGEAGYRCIAPDQRGYCATARPGGVEAYTIDHLVGDVASIADALDVDRFHLVGHDWGALIAWHAGARSADRVTTLTSISVPHVDAFDAQLADQASAQYAASGYFDLFTSPTAEDVFLANDKQVLRTVYTGLPQETIDAYCTFFDRDALTGGFNYYRANITDRRWNDAAGRIAVPTMLIWSTDDPALMREGAEATAQHVTGPYRFEVIEGVNHWVPELAADRVNELLLDHLSG